MKQLFLITLWLHLVSVSVLLSSENTDKGVCNNPARALLLVGMLCSSAATAMLSFMPLGLANNDTYNCINDVTNPHASCLVVSRMLFCDCSVVAMYKHFGRHHDGWNKVCCYGKVCATHASWHERRCLALQGMSPTDQRTFLDMCMPNVDAKWAA